MSDPGPPAPAHREVWCTACGGQGTQWCQSGHLVRACEACEGTGMALVPDEGDGE